MNYVNWHSKRATWSTLITLCAVGLVPASVYAGGGDEGPCSAIADLAFNACRAEVQQDFLIAKATCINISDAAERRQCKQAARADRNETKDLCRDQREARDDVCDLVGQGRYDPEWIPANYVDPDDIGNSVSPNIFFSLVPGTQWTYETDDESNTVTVTDKIKFVDGVRCRVVTDIVTASDGFVIEDTDDWYAQDHDGNVWYCGEEVKDFEVFEEDDPVEEELIAIDGSFKQGRDGAKAGIFVLANPLVGDSYRQEVDLGNAEDIVEVLSVSGTESAPGGSCNGDCLVTRDFTPLDPGIEENKYYAPGIGLIVEIGLDDGERNELTNFVQP